MWLNDPRARAGGFCIINQWTDSESQSSTTQQTSSTTSSTDARVGADNGSTVLQSGATQNISFDKNVADLGATAISKIVDFSSGALQAAASIVKDSIQSQTDVINGTLKFGSSALVASPATPAAAASSLAGVLNTSTLKPIYVIASVGALALIYFLMKRK